MEFLKRRIHQILERNLASRQIASWHHPPSDRHFTVHSVTGRLFRLQETSAYNGIPAGGIPIILRDIEGVASAIVDSLQSGETYRGYITQEERRSKMSPEEKINERARQLRSQVFYYRKELEQDGTPFGVLKGTYNMQGALDDDSICTILSFLNRPSPETWKECYPIFVAGAFSCLNAWQLHDTGAPRGELPESEWLSRYPNPDVLLDCIHLTVALRRAETSIKLDQAEIELRALIDAQQALGG